MTLPFLLAVTGAASQCQMIDHNSILARDVAAKVPQFEQFPEDFTFGFVLPSGTPRVLHGLDLQRIAKNRGIELENPPDICFARHTFIPDSRQLNQAMLAALKIEGARVEIVSSSTRPVPLGDIVFLQEGLQAPGVLPESLWHGYVRSGGQNTPIWAKVRITATLTRVVPVINLPAGKPIQASQVRLESCEDSPLDEITARHLDEVVGYVPKTSLRALAPIRKTQLDPRLDVTKGDAVKVQVFEGAAHLVFEGTAQSSGVKGSVVSVRNPSSGKEFRAQVTGKDIVTVAPFRAHQGEIQ